MSLSGGRAHTKKPWQQEALDEPGRLVFAHTGTMDGSIDEFYAFGCLSRYAEDGLRERALGAPSGRTRDRNRPTSPESGPT